jgi:hypothetical protein
MTGEAGVTCEPILRGPHDPPPLPGRHRPGGVIARPPPLHLDEGEPPTLERHEVDLADRRLVTPRNDAVAFQPKEKRNERFGEDAPGDMP